MGRRCLRFRDVAGLLQADRQRSMSQRIGRGERCQRQCCGDRLFQAPRVTKGANETVVGLVMGRISRDRFAKRLRRSGCVAGGEQVDAALGIDFCVVFGGLGHGSL